MSQAQDREATSRNSFGMFLSLLAGVSIGVIIGILIAPKPGKELRRDIKEKGEEFIERSRKSFEEVVDVTRDLVHKGKTKIEEFKEKGEEIWEKGKEKVAKTVIPKIEAVKEKVEKVVEEGKKKAKETEETLE
ncbi:MAG: YtxH domain-containing protein [Actinobacteria bacterium]|nr:YtxH domain-containing protein [Actinomycetota bacterium]